MLITRFQTNGITYALVVAPAGRYEAEAAAADIQADKSLWVSERQHRASRNLLVDASPERRERRAHYRRHYDLDAHRARTV